MLGAKRVGKTVCLEHFGLAHPSSIRARGASVGCSSGILINVFKMLSLVAEENHLMSEVVLVTDVMVLHKTVIWDPNAQ